MTATGTSVAREKEREKDTRFAIFGVPQGRDTPKKINLLTFYI
jgi:hypothetical protein